MSGALPVKPSVYGGMATPAPMAGEVGFNWKLFCAGSTNCGSVPGRMLFVKTAPELFMSGFRRAVKILFFSSDPGAW